MLRLLVILLAAGSAMCLAIAGVRLYDILEPWTHH